MNGRFKAADRQREIPSVPSATDFWTELEKNPTKRAKDAP